MAGDTLKALVSTDWLAGELGAADLRVFDASWYLPTEQRDAKAEYERAHIAGARFFDIDAVADTQSSLPHMVPTTAQFERMIGALGVCNASRIVFYDQKGLFSAPRAWWLMRLFGHEQCAVLDGGLPKWRAEDRALQQTQAPAPAVTSYRAAFNARRLRGLGDVLANVTTRRELLLDARSAERFHARVPEPRPGLRGGHVPGSRNLPFSELLTPQQTLLPAGELKARFQASGVDASREVITSCGSGLTAAILSLALHEAGLPMGALYDGSWSEWGARQDTPIDV
ncbi:MAG TPA: 3-mercaptopyruvate sulfurtransferase [Steroidobacteraceae bacterium]|jgi:thiosulfate/3-mercaptopyruvate sulfurtransferase|nr:3-mercaptopyruvate sulfurtransferase [Steroidobacteraceae bacterium]